MALPRKVLSSKKPKTRGPISRFATRNRLLEILSTGSGEVPNAQELFVEFLEHDTYNKDLSDRLLDLASRPVAWNVRELAVLMLENQTLKIDPEDWPAF